MEIGSKYLNAKQLLKTRRWQDLRGSVYWEIVWINILLVEVAFNCIQLTNFLLWMRVRCLMHSSYVEQLIYIFEYPVT